MIKKLIPFSLLLLMVQACDSARKAAATGDDGMITVTFLQMNDVYEISPLSDGSGGMSRVATIKKQLQSENPNTITVLAGDFISPSVIGSLSYQNDGKSTPIRGKQMIEAMNAVGVDYVTFGNHEFDYSKLADLQARIDESNFTWMGGNARLKVDENTPAMPFFKNKAGAKVDCPDETTVVLKDADGTIIKLGIFGVLTDTGRKPWVTYTDWMEAAKKSRDKLKSQNADVIVGLTHLIAADDTLLSRTLGDVPLIMGGHDHDNQIHYVGKNIVAKADANARTVYVHRLTYNKKTKTATVESKLMPVNTSIKEDPATGAVVAKWEKIKNDALSTSGFNATALVTDLKTPLDCRETIVRNKQAPVGDLINKAMLSVAKFKPELAVFNAGSVRIDDVLSGKVYELDVVRMLPFGGSISEVEMKGSLLKQMLDTGKSNVGIGGYLQLSANITESGGMWKINNQPIDLQRLYKIIMPSFLLTGNEQNMKFLKVSADASGKSDNPDIPVVHMPVENDKSDPRSDIRLALIKYWRAN